MTPQFVYRLTHTRVVKTPDEDFSEEKTLGLFLSLDDARRSEEDASAQPGFCDHPDGFDIECIPCDEALVYAENEGIEPGLDRLAADLPWVSDPRPTASSSTGIEFVDRLCALGAPAVIDLIQVLPEYFSGDELEAVQLFLLRLARARTASAEIDTVLSPASAESFWEFRRQGRPEEPDQVDDDGTFTTFTNWADRRRAHAEVFTLTLSPVTEPSVTSWRTLRDASYGPEEEAYLAELESVGSPTWGDLALASCLDRLRTGFLTDGMDIVIQQAWCSAARINVVYQPPFSDHIFGCTRRRHSPDLYRVYGPEDDTDDDPAVFGWNVADFDLGEPLVLEATTTEAGPHGIQWWGDLDSDWQRSG